MYAIYLLRRASVNVTITIVHLCFGVWVASLPFPCADFIFSCLVFKRVIYVFRCFCLFVCLLCTWDSLGVRGLSFAEFRSFRRRRKKLFNVKMDLYFWKKRWKKTKREKWTLKKTHTHNKKKKGRKQKRWHRLISYSYGVPGIHYDIVPGIIYQQITHVQHYEGKNGKKRRKKKQRRKTKWWSTCMVSLFHWLTLHQPTTLKGRVRSCHLSRFPKKNAITTKTTKITL